MIHQGISGVPEFESREFLEKKNKYCICIPIINEGKRIHDELRRAASASINKYADIVICDGGSNDGSTDDEILKDLGVNRDKMVNKLENSLNIELENELTIHSLDKNLKITVYYYI